jgi:hypothetical protein
VSVAVRLFLIVGLLAGQAPVCKVAVARSLTRTHAVQIATAPACKKGCCAAQRPPLPATPTRGNKPPTEPRCPTDCLSPLCSPVPVLNELPAAVVRDAVASEHLPATTAISPSCDYAFRLDRPPRA